MTMCKNITFNTILKKIGLLLLVLLLIFIVYLLYLLFSYSRIEDNQDLSVLAPEGATESFDVVSLNQNYSIGSFNVGFGAYSPDFSFFMDGGKESRCQSELSSADMINGAAGVALEDDPDFMLFQEVDIDSTRSCHVDQERILLNCFNNYYETFAVNYDSAYLFYPFTKPIGKSLSGICTFSKYKITSGIRRSLFIANDLNKFLDLDRCYSVSRIPVENGRELLLYNVHLSAYGNSSEIRDRQTSMLIDDMNAEYEAGNYIICGGDFNHELLADEDSTDDTEGWAYPFPRSKIPSHLAFALDLLSENDRNNLTLSSRDTSAPYVKGTTTCYMLDGFIISDNVKMTGYTVKDTGYKYSDHEEVLLDFILE